MARRKKPTRGGYREGAGRTTLFPGKVSSTGGTRADGGQIFVTKRVYGVLTEVGYEALMTKRDQLSVAEGREVSINEAIEWCIRKATRTAMSA